MRNLIITDIDHTISDAAWRDGMMPQGREAWDEYHLASVNDKPVDDIVHMLRSLHNSGYGVVGITVRPMKFRKMTMDWLCKWAIPIDIVLMRPDEDYRPAPEIKCGLLRESFPDTDRIAFALDDRDDVIAAYRTMGLTTLQVGARKCAQQ